jgi:transposase-like protein
VSAECPRCGCPSLRHLHDNAPDGAHLAGSERYECSQCGHVLTRREAIDAGLTYTLDRRKHERNAAPAVALHAARLARLSPRPDIADAMLLRELADLCERFGARIGGIGGVGVNRGDRLIFHGRLDVADPWVALRRAAEQMRK